MTYGMDFIIPDNPTYPKERDDTRGAHYLNNRIQLTLGTKKAG